MQSFQPYLKDLLQLFFIFQHNDIGFAVFCHKLACFRRVGGVDANTKPTAKKTGRTKVSVFKMTLDLQQLVRMFYDESL